MGLEYIRLVFAYSIFVHFFIFFDYFEMGVKYIGDSILQIEGEREVSPFPVWILFPQSHPFQFNFKQSSVEIFFKSLQICVKLLSQAGGKALAILTGCKSQEIAAEIFAAKQKGASALTLHYVITVQKIKSF